MKTKAAKHTFGHISTPVLCTVRSWRAPTLASASVVSAFTIAIARPQTIEAATCARLLELHYSSPSSFTAAISTALTVTSNTCDATMALSFAVLCIIAFIVTAFVPVNLITLL
jgi:hypothetical protein